MRAAAANLRITLDDRYRTVTTSLLGYGSTPDTRPDGNAIMAQQIDLIDRIIDRIGTSPHVVGHSYGGLSALVHALTGQRTPQSLLLVEANPLGFLRAMGDLEHYAMFESMTRPYFADFARGDPEAARHVIDIDPADEATRAQAAEPPRRAWPHN